MTRLHLVPFVSALALTACASGSGSGSGTAGSADAAVLAQLSAVGAACTPELPRPAVEACAGKMAGDACTVTREHQTVNATCGNDDGVLMCGADEDNEHLPTALTDPCTGKAAGGPTRLGAEVGDPGWIAGAGSGRLDSRAHRVPAARGAAARAGGRRRPMCRNIRVLYNFEPPTTREEIRGAALQFVRKVSGLHGPSAADSAAFERAVDEVAGATERLLGSLRARTQVRTREGEREKARERGRRREERQRLG